MTKVTGLIVSEEWGSTLWINGKVLQMMCPVLKDFFQLDKAHFLPTLYYCEMQLGNRKVGDTIPLLKPRQIWRKYVADDYEFPLLFGYREVVDAYNSFIRQNPFILEQPLLLWTFGLLAYFIVDTPVKDWTNWMLNSKKRMDFLQHKQSDMLRMLEFLQENERFLQKGSPKAQPVTITTAYGSVKIDNFENYFWDYIRRYVNRNKKHLTSEVKEPPRSGRQKEMDVLRLTICLYNFFSEVSNLNKGHISKKLCLFILCFFRIIRWAEIVSLDDYEDLQLLLKRTKDEKEARKYQMRLKYCKSEELWVKTIADRIKKYKDNPEINRMDWGGILPRQQKP